jgi:hypothetical protein
LNCAEIWKSYIISVIEFIHRNAIGRFMKKPTMLHSLSLIVCSSIAALAMSAPAFAQHGGGGGGHAGGAVGHGGYGGGHYGGYGGYHGGYGGYHGGYGGYGYRGGWGYGWRGGYGGYYGPWGWGGLGLGLYFATLPLYYSTVWWGGVPYYYADDTYYRWDGTVNQYETVSPPPGLQAPAAGQSSAGSELIAYPKNGQSQEQQGKDKYECYRWAADQTGFDPTQPGGGSAPGRRADYSRAQAACLEGRGYSVK